MSVLIQPSDVSELAADLSGPVFLPEDAGYSEEIAGFNSSVIHRPGVVVGPATASDVATVLRYATAHGLPVAVQATGHGATMPFETGLLISTRRLDTVSVDPATRTATVGAGARWRGVIQAAAEHGLAPLSGSSSDVGAVGYALGGGLPVMCRTFGFAADHVLGADLVTADGVLRRIDADHEPDLLWALCGGKGNLGVVVAMTIGLVPVSTVYGGGMFYAAEDITAVLHGYLDWAETMTEQTSTSVAILRLPPAPQLPEPIRGRTVAHLRMCHVGDPAEGERLVAPLRTVAPALLDSLQEMPYTGVDAIHADPDHPVPLVQRGSLLRELTHETVDALLAVAGPDAQIPLMVCELRQMGGSTPGSGGRERGRRTPRRLQPQRGRTADPGHGRLRAGRRRCGHRRRRALVDRGHTAEPARPAGGRSGPGPRLGSSHLPAAGRAVPAAGSRGSAPPRARHRPRAPPVTTAHLRRVWADPRYARRVRKWEQLSSAATPDLLQRLEPQPGERMLDVGCGTGAATFPAAALVGPDGALVGADVSTAAVQVAGERATHLRAGNATFEVADMQTARVAGGPFDAAMSQFGMMFFDDPVAAFANIRDHLRPAGRLCFSCW